MKKFTISNDVFIKNKLHTFDIYNYIIISLIPLIVFNTYINKDFIFYILLSIVLGLAVKIILNNKKYLNIKEIIIISTIFSLLIFKINNIVIFIIVNIVLYLLHILFTKKRFLVNPMYVSLSICYLIEGNNMMTSNNYIYLLLILLSYIFLIYKKCLKTNIVLVSTVTYLLLSSIIMIIFKLDISKVLNPYTFIIILYLVGNIETSPINKKIKKLFSCLLGVVLSLSLIINNMVIIFILMFIINIFSMYLDNYFIFKTV